MPCVCVCVCTIFPKAFPKLIFKEHLSSIAFYRSSDKMLGSVIMVLQLTNWSFCILMWKMAVPHMECHVHITHMGLPGGLYSKESACNEEDLGLIPGWEDPLEEGMATSPVLLPGESHGQRSLEGYGPWSRKESDTTGRLSPARHIAHIFCYLALSQWLSTFSNWLQIT